MYIPALVFAQGKLNINLWKILIELAKKNQIVSVTKHNVQIVNLITCYICVIYTMLGGIKAVVWTNVRYYLRKRGEYIENQIE